MPPKKHPIAVPAESALLFSRARLPWAPPGALTDGHYDVLVVEGTIRAVGEQLEAPKDARVVDARGRALIPGIHDHHLHLFALAAAAHSVDCAPLRSREALQTAVRRASRATTGIVRAIGYSPSLAGDLDRNALDALVGDVAVRVQHRSGALWILNTAALVQLRLIGTHDTPPHPSLELDAQGVPTGRVWRGDDWLRSLLPSIPPPLGGIGRELTALGVVGVTDATPDLGGAGLAHLRAARQSGDLPQRLQILHSPSISDTIMPELVVGPRKIVLADHALPEVDDLVHQIELARASKRGIAAHVISADALALLLAALEATGTSRADRVEHAAVVPSAMLDDLARSGITVVTQPGFIATRRDKLDADLGEGGTSALYRAASLETAGVPLALSSDAPYGPLSPWVTIAAAATRVTPFGRTMGPEERLHPRRALERLLSPLNAPGAAARSVAPGCAADLVLLDAPLDEVLETATTGAATSFPSPVKMTVVAGNVLYERGD